MIGFDISLNDERLFTAGAGERGVLTACITWVLREAPGVRRPSDLRLEVGGLSKDAHLKWPSPRKLRVGDRVVVAIVETTRPDPPSRRERDDPALREASERRYYQHLKAKYDPAEVPRSERESRRRTTKRWS
jgi:hypothetical protein